MKLQNHANSKGPAARPREIGKHLQIHPNMCFGRLTFKGTRMPVEVVLHYLAEGHNIEDVQAGWPGICREAVKEAVWLAAMALVDVTRARSWKPESDPPRPWARRRTRRPRKARAK